MTGTVQLTVSEAVTILRTHDYRLVSDDPYKPRQMFRYCLVCNVSWPCGMRLEADWTIRLADELLAARRAEETPDGPDTALTPPPPT